MGLQVKALPVEVGDRRSGNLNGVDSGSGHSESVSCSAVSDFV